MAALLSKGTIHVVQHKQKKARDESPGKRLPAPIAWKATPTYLWLGMPYGAMADVEAWSELGDDDGEWWWCAFFELRKRPPEPLTLLTAWRWRDSCIYGFLVLSSLFCATSFARICLLLSIPWYCFAFTKMSPSSATSNGSGSRALEKPTTSWGWTKHIEFHKP